MSERPARHHIGHRVRANWGSGGGVRAEGWMYGHSVSPVVYLVTDDGETIDWRDTLCEVVGPEDMPALTAAIQARDERAARLAAVEAERDALRATVERVEVLAATWDAEGWDYPAGAAYDLRAALAGEGR